MKPLISIIMPVYNAEKFIASAIESCLNQSFDNFELIIVNDGSTDQTLNEINKFSDKRIKLFSIKNSGQCVATNYGLQVSKGNYVQYLDADDFLSDDKLFNQVNLLNEKEDIIVFCKWASIINKQIYLENDLLIYNSKTLKDFYFNQLYYSNMLANSCYLIPKKLIKIAGGYDVTLHYNNDFEYFNRTISYANNIIFDSKSVSYYRRNVNNSITSIYSDVDANSEFKAKLLSSKSLLLIYNNEKWIRDSISILFGNYFYKLACNNYVYLVDVYNKDLKLININPKIKYSKNLFNKFAYFFGVLNTIKLRELYLRYLEF